MAGTSLDSGAVLRPEDCVRVETYPVRVIDGTVAVQLPLSKNEQEEKAA
jgi:nitrite reductase/ring-hydroxylating ferredoxin subunit